MLGTGGLKENKTDIMQPCSPNAENSIISHFQHISAKFCMATTPRFGRLNKNSHPPYPVIIHLNVAIVLLSTQEAFDRSV